MRRSRTAPPINARHHELGSRAPAGRCDRRCRRRKREKNGTSQPWEYWAALHLSEIMPRAGQYVQTTATISAERVSQTWAGSEPKRFISFSMAVVFEGIPKTITPSKPNSAQVLRALRARGLQSSLYHKSLASLPL